MTDEQVKKLAQLFAEAGHQHHQAYIETDGADPDWPIWYADYLVDKLPEHLGSATPTRSEIVVLLVELEREQHAQAPGAKWVDYYARALLKRYSV